MTEPVTLDLVQQHLAYLARVANEHETAVITKWVAEGLAPCFMCGEVCQFQSMIRTTTGRAFCDHICIRAYAS